MRRDITLNENLGSKEHKTNKQTTPKPKNVYSGDAPITSYSAKWQILPLKLWFERAKDWDPVSKLGVS